MNSETVQQRGQRLVDLHSSGEIIVLPTVWDAFSARIAVEAGFPALTVGSHPVAEAFGLPDGEAQPFDEYLEQVSRIAAAVDVPVSVDVESGYGLPPQELIRLVLETGAVGVNIEDTLHQEEGRVRGRQELFDYIATAVEAAKGAGVPFVLNGRTDALVHGTELFEDPLAEALERIQAMAEAGALSVYPVGLPDAASVKKAVDAVSVPLNVTADPIDGHPAGGLAQLRELGVRRVTFGPKWQARLKEPAAQMLHAWRG
ncbi:isocitrate lyase/PEP mutase family protein [Galactobacter caseinivorans]|uniref:Isocitrate lyase/phosphoenolpyruvate mutase family protein n=1 Tax=Galactobacter caseinivorans TaxID=2676123 RepID=A0A496PHJ8_9MICC|nr:isocitrate lyase/phosphoenolpyruvate mutase family protein [Galactobacter caseinivorans]RKW69958.1 isocitrate lyase/phosphoenolpyruvate mutase family protein [Galactobacter caseinivorans]